MRSGVGKNCRCGFRAKIKMLDIAGLIGKNCLPIDWLLT